MDSTMPDRGLPLSLWGIWWNAILLLRPAFSRLRTFMWFATAVAGLTVRLELLGVTSIVRALNLRPRLYTKLLDHFHSRGINLDRLSALWTQAVLQMFPHLVRVNGRLVLVGDGIKAPKRGKKMPAVKLLHQQSESNTKPEYIMGHSMQAVGLLVHAAKSVFSVPLAVRIHEGLVWSNRDKRTLLDKMQAGCAPDRFILIPFLDERHDPIELPQRQSIPPSQIARLPQPCQTQNARLPCLHPGWRGRPGIAPVSRRRRSQACLEFLRVLAAHHSSRHPAIGVCRGKSAAPDTSRISHGSCKKRFPHEIHRRAAGHAKQGNFPLGFVKKTGAS